MQRYFIQEENFSEDQVYLTGDDYHHCVRVMRMQVGDQFIAASPIGNTFICKITEIDANRVKCKMVETLNSNNELPVNVTIAQGLPKGDKLDLIVQKCTELGMAHFVPLQMDRSVVKWDYKKEEKKLERLRKISKEASEQSHRSFIPQIHSKSTLQSLFDQHYDFYLVASETLAKTKQHQAAFKSVLNQIDDGSKILVIIGPEGGFSDDELEYLSSKKCTFIRLGKRILRTETAPIYVLSAISFFIEEWRCQV